MNKFIRLLVSLATTLQHGTISGQSEEKTSTTVRKKINYAQG